MPSVKELKANTDKAFKDLKEAKEEVVKLKVKLEEAQNRKAFENAHRLDSRLATARAKVKAIESEYEEAQRAEFGAWVPHSKDCTS